MKNKIRYKQSADAVRKRKYRTELKKCQKDLERKSKLRKEKVCGANRKRQNL